MLLGHFVFCTMTYPLMTGTTNLEIWVKPSLICSHFKHAIPIGSLDGALLCNIKYAMEIHSIRGVILCGCALCYLAVMLMYRPHRTKGDSWLLRWVYDCAHQERLHSHLPFSRKSLTTDVHGYYRLLGTGYTPLVVCDIWMASSVGLHANAFCQVYSVYYPQGKAISALRPWEHIIAPFGGRNVLSIKGDS